MRPNGRSLAGLALSAMLVASGCGGSSSNSSAGAGDGSTQSGGTLTVFAASSLTGAFTALKATYESAHPGWTVNLNFAGSDQLAAQIEQGVSADVFAGASPKYPEQLQAKNLLGPTKTFATNTLILAVPASNPAQLTSVHDLTKGAKLVIGDPAVPLGSYTETVLTNLGLNDSQLNIVSKEQDAKSVLAKITLGEADAGFVYITDARSAGSKVQQIRLPAAGQATATYPIGIVSSGKNAQAAQQWIDLITGPQGQNVLKGLGFGPAPST